MGIPRVTIVNTDASKNVSLFGIETGGKHRKRMFFLDYPELSHAVAIETEQPRFACLYHPMEVQTSRGRQRVWVDKTSFKTRFSKGNSEIEFFNKICSAKRSENISFEQQSPEKYSPKTIALWRKISEFTPNPPLLAEVERMATHRIQLGPIGIKLKREDRGRTMIVSPRGQYFVCLTRSETHGDFVNNAGAGKKIKVAINRSNLDERIVATGKKNKNPQYLKEIQVLEKLRGEKEFVQIDAWAESNDKFYIVMEKCAGNLWDRVNDVNDWQKLPLALDYARGIEKLHNRNIIHRDIKPHNLLISLKDGIVRGKICDFGDAADGKSDYGPGTASFSWDPAMSRDRAPDKKVDIWALGSALYFLFHPTHQVLPYQTIESYGSAVRALESTNQEQMDWTVDHSGISDIRLRNLLKSMLQVDRRKRIDAPQVVRSLEEIQKNPQRFWHPYTIPVRNRIQTIWDKAVNLLSNIQKKLLS